MVTFFHDLLKRLQGMDGRRTTDGTRTAPHRRRKNARLHRLLAAVCAGLAMFAALQCVRLTISTQPVVIAAQPIAKGSVITSDSLALRDLPYDKALRNVFHDCADAVGLIAQVDVAEGGIVTSTMARASPVVSGNRSAIGKFRRQSVAWRCRDTFQRHDIRRGHAGNGTGYGCGVVT